MPVKRFHKPSADKILEAAEKVIAQHGYADVSLRQLMSGAGVSTTAFYARFASKEAVIAALVARLFEDLYKAAPTVLDQARDLETGIEVGVELLCDRFGPRKALIKAMLSEAGGAEDAVNARRKAYSLLAGFLANRLAALVDRGRIEPIDTGALAWALVGALEIQIVRWAVWDELELPALRQQLKATARAILPAMKKEPS